MSLSRAVLAGARGLLKGLAGAHKTTRVGKQARQRPPRMPRTRGRRPADYFPWQEQGDDLPELE